MDKWIDIPYSKRHVAIHQGFNRLYIMGAMEIFFQGRPLTEIEQIMADEIFRLRASIEAAQHGVQPTAFWPDDEIDAATDEVIRRSEDESE